MRELKATDYMCGLGALIVGFGLYSFHVRDLLASLVLFTIAFFFLGLATFGVFLIWCASEKVVIWTRPASRNMMALSRRLIAAYTRP